MKIITVSCCCAMRIYKYSHVYKIKESVRNFNQNKHKKLIKYNI